MESFPDIPSLIEQISKKVFLSRLLTLDFLANRPEYIPTLATWLYDEWHPYDATLTKERLIQNFHLRLNIDKLPITFIVIKKKLLIGAVSLKNSEDPAFSDILEPSIWLGSLHVADSHRNQGIGKALLQLAKSIAKELKYKKMYFYTSNSTNVNWYIKNGAQVIDTRTFHQHTVTLMFIPIQL